VRTRQHRQQRVDRTFAGPRDALLGETADVRGGYHLFVAHQPQICRRFGRERVNRVGAQVISIQRAPYRVLVDELGARRVHQHRTCTQQREARSVQQRPLAGRRVQREHIGAAEHLLQRSPLEPLRRLPLRIGTGVIA
jgi:hypothetical protein